MTWLLVGLSPYFSWIILLPQNLNPKVTAKIVKGIANACKKSNCALLGGETAEMPGHYAKDNFDLAGFSVGVVEKKSLINGKGIKPGHILLGIESSGPHSNGYSLIRSILKKHKAPDSIMRVLLKPTHLYPAPCSRTNQKNQCQRYGAYNWRRFDRKYSTNT
jgi:phosphoribosylformylglycinamidine cyclo-ligase